MSSHNQLEPAGEDYLFEQLNQSEVQVFIYVMNKQIDNINKRNRSDSERGRDRPEKKKTHLALPYAQDPDRSPTLCPLHQTRMILLCLQLFLTDNKWKI